VHMNTDSFEIKSTDLAGRIGVLETKTSRFETPALLPVIHPVRQLVPCMEIKSMGFEAVMTNAYTTYKRLNQRALEGIHRIIGFDGTVMTDSGGYQVLEFGSVEIDPLEMASFEEKIGSDIAIILDKPTGLNVTKNFSRRTVLETLDSARKTKQFLTRSDMIWTLPVQGGKYIDLVARSAKESAKLDYGCYALGSPVEVMEEYNFSLLVEMIKASKSYLPVNRPFHLFGAGHPLIIPLAVALGCDMFDSASYMLYARNDRYISTAGTIRLEQLEYLPCNCPVCSKITAKELKSLRAEDRVFAIARHNLYVLKQVIEETKQAIWEGRLWEYVRAKCSNHPMAFSAFKLAMSDTDYVDNGTSDLKDRGIFLNDMSDVLRPEIRRHFRKVQSLNLAKKSHLVLVPEPKTKPFLTSDLFSDLLKIVDPNTTLICCISPIFGIIPAEISDIFPVSQVTHTIDNYERAEFPLNAKKWTRIDALIKSPDPSSKWLAEQLGRYSKKFKSKTVVSRDYKLLKRILAQV
jgi:7-cyano-7-deazaguanine tRNA-ribosyltransferase